MPLIAQSDPIAIREMLACEADFRLFLKWMTDPDTMIFWEGLSSLYTYDRVVAEYEENVAEGVTPCIIEYDGKPIGFCQFCPLDAEYYLVPEDAYRAHLGDAETVYGIDIILGDTAYRDRGVGTACMKLLVGALFEKHGADAVLIDPKVHNARAIRCYHKCGFLDYFIAPKREKLEGVMHDNLIMGIRRAEWEKANPKRPADGSPPRQAPERVDAGGSGGS